MSFVFKIIDCCCFALWIAVLFLNKILHWCYLGIMFILFAVWTSIGGIKGISKPYKKINDFFRTFYPKVKCIFVFIFDNYSFILHKISDSKKLKRCFAVVLIIVIAFFI